MVNPPGLAIVTFTIWLVVIGLLLVGMALSGSILKRLPLSSSMLYLAAGFGLGPAGFGLIRLDPVWASAFLEHFSEIAVIVSLFTAGLKLRLPIRDDRWSIPVRLAFASMAITVGFIALVGVLGLRLPVGAALLLGAVLAPTDPVLASDVQTEDVTDTDRLRFSLTGEAGLNDGTAFPFVMLGLGLLGLHELGVAGWRWFVIDVAWAIVGGLGIGGLLGLLIARLVVYLRRVHREAVGLDDFLALGLICLAYGVSTLAHAYGFLAVFAAGLALRRVERLSSGERPPEEVVDVASAQEEAATHPEKAAAYMAEAVLGFNRQLERILEVAVVLLLGGMLSRRDLTTEAVWFVPLLLLLIRPVAVATALVGAPVSKLQRGLIAWFGIRGIGSIYYLMYAIQHGLPPDLSGRLTGLTFTTVTASIFVHGISVTPLMERYRRKASADREGGAPD